MKTVRFVPKVPPYAISSVRHPARLSIITGALALAAIFASASISADTGKPPATQEDRRMVALVTGSTSGLGREVALRLAERTLHVIVHGRDSGRGEAVVKEIEERGGSARFYAADFARLADVRQLAKAIQRDMDTDMVREAGITPRSTVDEGANAVMQPITGEGLENGAYFSGLRPARAHAQASDKEARERLWALSRRLALMD